MTTLYSDGVVNVSMYEGNVRLELVRILQIDADAPPKYEVENVLVMSPPAFLRLYQGVGGMITKLIEQGILNKNDGPTNLEPPQADFSKDNNSENNPKAKGGMFKDIFGKKSIH